MIAAWLALACAPDAPPGPDADTDVAPDADTEAPTTDHTYDEGEIAPLLDVPGVEDALSDALAWTGALDPALVLDAWLRAEALTEPACPYYEPGWEEAYDYWYWHDTCDTSAGTHFDGSFYGNTFEPYSDGAYTYFDYGWFAGDAWVVFPDGQELRIGGDLYLYRLASHDGATTGAYARFVGGASWVGADYADTWLAEAPSFDLELSGTNAGGVVSLSLDGGVSGVPGTFGAVVFHDVNMQSSACALEPGGRVSAIDARGETYTVVFHGPTADPEDAAEGACDGCGDLWFRGALLGAACPDLAPITTFTGEAP